MGLSDQDILAEFRSLGDNGAEDDDGLTIEEPPPPKRPSKHEVSAAIDVLETYSLFLNNQFVDFKFGMFCFVVFMLLHC